MIKKNKRSTSYLNHPLNNSPSKTTVKFGNQPRFIQQKTFSPDKFYDLPDALEKKTTSFGYGKKVDFTQEHVGDPGKYNLRSEFDQICQGYRFGVRPPMRQLPKELFKDKSPPNILKRTHSALFEPSVHQNSSSSKKKVSPQTSFKRQKQEENSILRNKQRNKQGVEKNEAPRQKKSAYRLKYEYSNSYLLDNKKSSCKTLPQIDIEFIREKKQSPSKHNLSTFGVGTKLKRDHSFRNVGPGSQQSVCYQVIDFHSLGKIKTPTDLLDVFRALLLFCFLLVIFSMSSYYSHAIA